MKKSKVKRTIATLVAMAVCICQSNTLVLAEGEESSCESVITARNIVLITATSILTAGTLGNLTIYGSTEVRFDCDAEIVVELQQFDKTWKTMKTWSAKQQAAMHIEKEQRVPIGYAYRLKSTHTAYNRRTNEVLDTVTKYSSAVEVQ